MYNLKVTLLKIQKSLSIQGELCKVMGELQRIQLVRLDEAKSTGVLCDIENTVRVKKEVV